VTELLDIVRTKLEQVKNSLGLSESGSKPDEDLPESTSSFPDEARRVALEIFEDNLSVRNLQNSYVLEIGFTSLDAAKSAAIANHLARLYVRKQLQEKINAARATNLRIAGRLQIQQQSVLDAERRIAEIRSARQFVAGRGAVLTETALEELNRELIRTTAEQAKVEAKLALVSTLRATGDRLDALAEVIASPVITQLRIQQIELIQRVAESVAVYGEQHSRTLALREDLKRVSTRAGEEVDRIVRGLQNEFDSLSAQAGALERRLHAAKDRNAEDNMAAVQLQELERDAAAKRPVYEELLRRYQETSEVQDILEADAQVISAAEVPTEPSSLAPASIAAVGFVISALLGCVLALLREEMDRKLRSHRQIESSLQVPCLGLVPNVKGLGQSGRLHDPLRRSPVRLTPNPYEDSMRG
jgi:uncharacterized protein involved in exopolysaccharide biosynthesis